MPADVTPRAEVFQANLRALAACSPAVAERIRNAAPRTDVRFFVAADGEVGAVVGEGSGSRLLASARRPAEEGRLLAGTVPVEDAGGVVVLGFGLGYHVRALAERLGRSGVLVVFEPDVPLLRAVLERVEFARWVARTNVVLLTDPDDAGAIAAGVRGVEGVLAIGVRLLEHPPSVPRLGEAGQRFAQRFTQVLRALRSQVLTTMCQVGATFRNKLMNLEPYALWPGLADLAGKCAGRPAIVVSAGPSLRRNIDLLGPASSRAIIIATQTVLRTLLRRGIRPHFVTALDHAEISRRFYEGLTESDVRDITLVAEAQVNPVVTTAFPGPMRFPRDEMLDGVLGEGLVRQRGDLPDGATVAHLAYYLARFLGCDPVILVGQDLGFTDGQYYSASAAIHDVWACELGEFNTLETMEWQRIVRARALLTKVRDIRDRPIYTDEQMNSYLVQFERDFGADAARGLRTIDATEGGVRKAHTEVMPLAEALRRHALAEVDPPPPPAREPDPGAVIGHLRERVGRIRTDVSRVGRDSREAAGLLSRMLAVHADQPRVNRLIGQVHRIAERVTGLRPAYEMVQLLNQTGALKRFKADRDLGLGRDLSPLERQRRQIERDLMNVEWLGDAADELADLLAAAESALRGGPRLTRDAPARPARTKPARRLRVAAVVPLDARTGGLGTARVLSRPIRHGLDAPAMTLARLARCRRLDGVILLGEDEGELERVSAMAPAGLGVHAVRTPRAPMGARSRVVGAARLWMAECWRGGVGGLTCADEAFPPDAAARALDDLGFDACVPVGPDWCLVDPGLIDGAIERHAEHTQGLRLVISQAPPGLGAFVVERALVRDIAAATHAGPRATLGGLLTYHPGAPQADAIGRSMCLHVPPAARDLGERVIADSPARIERIGGAIDRLGSSWVEADADAVARALADVPWTDPPRLLRVDVEDAPDIARLIEPCAAAHPDLALTLRFRGRSGAGEIAEAVTAARQAGAAGVHVRVADPGEGVFAELLSLPIDVLSLEVMADGPREARAVLEGWARRECPVRTWRLPWVVPRLTRRDAVYEPLESVFDGLLAWAGAFVIDPLDAPIPGERIEPLPLPPAAARRLERTLAGTGIERLALVEA
jgi:hypothetical protein